MCRRFNIFNTVLFSPLSEKQNINIFFSIRLMKIEKCLDENLLLGLPYMVNKFIQPT
jgi:hypothetical protein